MDIYGRATVQMKSVECCSCHTTFAMTEELYDQRRSDHKSFWCPQGHKQYFTGMSDEEKLKSKLTAEKRRAEQLQACCSRANQENQHLRRSRAATKAVVTKLKRKYEPDEEDSLEALGRMADVLSND